MKIQATMKGILMDVYKDPKKKDGVDILVPMISVYQSSTKQQINIKIEDEIEFEKFKSKIHKEVQFEAILQDWAFNNRSGMSCKIVF